MPGPTGALADGGRTGPAGELGAGGPPGAMGCHGLKAGESRGIVATLVASAPANGQFFVTGEHAVLDITVSDRCGLTYPLAELGSAALYLTGPRGNLAATSACGLLNCTTDRTVEGHHHIDLQAPSYADASLAGLAVQPDATLRYELGAVSVEPAGTYSALLLVAGPDAIDQLAVTAELQIGTSTASTNASGPPTASTCASCHRSPMNGHLYMHHSFPSPYTSAFGSFDIDSLPTETCFACHNADGYSPNTIVGKVHGLHRGADQLAPGVAHPDYGRPADPSLLAYTNVGFPAMPSAELACATCHTDDRWKQKPSRMACGTCHDNVYFDTGTLSPPRQFATACTTDGDCSTLGSYVTCDGPTLTCMRKSHAVQHDDSACAGCHAADTGFAPIAAAHEVVQQTRDPGLHETAVTLTGGSGVSGTFVIGDTPVLRFRVADKSNVSITDLVTNAAYAVSMTVAGPTSAPEQLYPGSLSLKATLDYDAAADLYTYTFPSPLPASALAPLDSPAPYARPNPPGTYTAWLYVVKTTTVDGASVRNTGDYFVHFDFGTTAPLQPRQVISDASCNTCHVNVQAHGGTRQNAEGCFTCHTAGALDVGVGGKGTACSSDAQCSGAQAGWEQCQDTKAPAGLDTCVVVVDPTPSSSIDFRVLIHKIHFARLLGGYAERDNLGAAAGRLTILGRKNTLADLGDALFPQDVRSCKTCHSDTKATCSSAAPCGYGQTCTGGACVNTAWLEPSATVCLSCHDTEDAFAHTQLNTWAGTSPPVETCGVCHGQGAQFSVDAVHEITNPYVPPYPRE